MQGNRAVLIRTYGATAIFILMTLASSVMIARLLGPESRGLLLALTFWPSFIAASLCLGINESTALHVGRDVAATGGADVGAGGNAHASAGLALQIMVAAVVTPIVLLLLPIVLSDRPDSLHLVLVYSSVFVALMLLDLHGKAVLQGRGQFNALNLVRLVQPVGYAGAIAGLALTGHANVSSVMAAMLGTCAVSALSGLAFTWSSPFRARWREMRELLATGWSFHVANLVVYAANEADKVIVLKLLSDREIGYFSVAAAFGMLGINFVVQSLAVTLTADMSAAVSQPQRLRVVKTSINDATLLLLVCNGLGVALTPFWLPLLFGEEFRPAIPVAMLLLTSGGVRGLRMVVDRAMRAAHNTTCGIRSEIASLATLLVLGIAGTFFAGLEGLAVASLCAQLVGLGVVMVAAARILDVETGAVIPFRDPDCSRLLAPLLRRR